MNPGSGKGIKHLDAGLSEIAGVPAGDGQAMRERGSGNQAVLVWHRLAGSTEVGKKLGPTQTGRDTVDAFDTLGKPASSRRRRLSGGNR